MAAPVTAFDDELRGLVEDMYETMDAAHGVGLAAPQIGVGLRVFTYDMSNDDGVPARGVVVNPVVTTSAVPVTHRTRTTTPRAACPCRARASRSSGRWSLGCPALTLRGRLGFTATGWFARCMQHEFDHLNGTLYVDRLDGRWLKKARKAVRRTAGARPG